MKILRTLAVSSILLSMLSPVVSAEGDIYVDANNATVNTPQATINVSDTIVINGNVYINGTILRSINNQEAGSYFRPKFGDIPFIKDLVMKDKGKGAVYTGEFDLNPITQQFDEVNRREYEILGRDIILESEEYDNGVYSAKEMSKQLVSRYNSIMALYKALGKNEYKIDLVPEDVAEDVSINSSPLLEVVKTPAIKVYKEGYYTNVFITRTVPDKYWGKAQDDGIILKGEDQTTPNGITIGEFSQYVAAMMNLKGEPVITKQEEEILLTTYGRQIPYYLPSQQTEAVKYLMVRGVVDNTLNFRNKLDRDTMLTVLSRAKDVSSRLTFKQVTIPYIPSLVQSGFYPTETAVTVTPIQNVSWSTGSVAVENYYDYYVKVIPKKTDESMPTVFKSEDGRENYNLYVSSVYNNISAAPYKDSSFLGVENGFYHFRVPINIIEDDNAFMCYEVGVNGKETPTAKQNCYYSADKDQRSAFKGYITINSSSLSDAPGNIKLEFGGGVYLVAEPRVANGTSDDEYVMSRIPFTPDYSDRLVDRDRKISAQGSVSEGIPLAKSKAVMSFQSDDISKLMWDGKPLSEASVFAKDPSGSNLYTITVEAPDPFREIMSLLTTTKLDTGGVGTSPAYIKDDRTALVSLNYLRKNKVLDSAVQLSTGKCPANSSSQTCGTYMLYSDKSNILVDTVNRIIVAGQSVIEIPEDDPSPLIIPNPQTGEYLIDARAVQGVGSELFIVKSEGGAVSVSLTTDKKPGYQWSTIYPFLGEQGSLYVRTNNNVSDLRVYLEDSYPLSNFLLYRSRNASINEDFLIVFKPRVTGVNDEVPTDVIADLKRKFHIELGANETVAIYPLNTQIVHQKQYSKVIDLESDAYGYYYKAPSFEEFNYMGYLKNKDGTHPIPMVTVKDGSHLQILDMNMNVISGKEDRYPASVLSAVVHSTIKPGAASSMIFSNKPGYTKGETFGVTKDTFIAAPAGVQAKYYPLTALSWTDVSSRGAIYVGTMLAQIDWKVTTQDTSIDLKSKGGAIHYSTDSFSASQSSPFHEVFRGTKSSIFVYDSPGKSRLIDFTVTNPTGVANPDFITTSGSRNVFDWLAYKFQNSLQNTDDFMTITVIFLLNVIPRAMLFLLIGFSTLTLVKNQRIVQYICDHWIDIYKVTSFGISSIDKVTIRGIWVSTFFAVVLLSLLNSGQILDVFAWITRGLHGILNR